jgi:hypothetical protein
MAIYAIIWHLKTQCFSFYTNAYYARSIFIKYGINTGSIRIKTGSRKNGRNKLSPVSVPFPYFSVNTETVGSNIENVRVRTGLYPSVFNPNREQEFFYFLF